MRTHLGKVRRAAIRGVVLVALLITSLSMAAQAQVNPFSGGWELQPSLSRLEFQSVKNQTVVESSSFATISGAIDENGLARVSLLLDSVDTKVDLRNVRMRFLFFETFKYPEAVVTTLIDPAALTDLAQVRRKQVPITYSFDLHGVTNTYDTVVDATFISDEMVSITSRTPISIAVSDFNLLEGLNKLQEAANVVIIPSTTVSFDLVFARGASRVRTAPADETSNGVASVALEAQGDFDLKACEGRFEILSRTGNIYFASGSARLQNTSTPLLNSLADIIKRCPGMRIEIGGHTDSVGSDALNERLSQARAASVTNYLLSQGLNAQTLVSKGYGESTPIATNDTDDGRARNRRIEFKVLVQ